MLLNRIFGDKYYCGLDIGAQSMKASLVYAKDLQNIELLGVHEEKTVGVKGTSISDLGELSEGIGLTMSGLTRKTGVKIKDVQLGIGGELVENRSSRTVIPLVDKGNKIITSQDIKKVCGQARLLGVDLEEEVIHEFPQYFRVDDVNIALNPIGLIGRKLEVDLLLVIANAARVRNLSKAVNQAGYEVAQVFYNTYAASETCLEKYMKDEGVAMVDIGSSYTNVLIFKDGRMSYMECFPSGGDQMTQCIARDLNLSFDLAEDIKKSYAVAKKEDVGDDEVLVKRDDAYIPIKRDVIYEAVEPEITAFVDNIQRIVGESGVSDQLKEGVVIVGGGAFLPGLVERIEANLNLPAKVGAMTKGLQNSAKYSSAIGLAQLGFTESIGYSLATNSTRRWQDSFATKIKELYQEYF